MDQSHRSLGGRWKRLRCRGRLAGKSSAAVRSQLKGILHLAAFCNEGQEERKDGAAAPLTLGAADVKRSIVTRHDLLAHPESKTGSLNPLGCEKCIEDIFQDLRTHSFPGIRDS